MTDATARWVVVETPATQARHGPLRAGAVVSAAPAPKPKLLDQVRDAIRTRHYSYRTEEAYVGWIKRFILFTEAVSFPGHRQAVGPGGTYAIVYRELYPTPGPNHQILLKDLHTGIATPR